MREAQQITVAPRDLPLPEETLSAAPVVVPVVGKATPWTVVPVETAEVQPEEILETVLAEPASQGPGTPEAITCSSQEAVRAVRQRLAEPTGLAYQQP